jgi:hypothetical protein
MSQENSKMMLRKRLSSRMRAPWNVVVRGRDSISTGTLRTPDRLYRLCGDHFPSFLDCPFVRAILATVLQLQVEIYQRHHSVHC